VDSSNETGIFILEKIMTNEQIPSSGEVIEISPSVMCLIQECFSDDLEFVLEELEDEGDIIGFLYGQLIEEGFADPDTILRKFGITEENL
jgi:hypothetical protein